MRVTCRHCNEVAKVYATRRETADLRTLYVTCEACGTKMVWHLSWSHDVTGPETDFARLADELLEKLSETERRELLDRWRPAPQTLTQGGGNRG